GLQMELQLMLGLGRDEQLRGVLLSSEMEDNKSNLGLLNVPAPPLPGYPRFYRLAAVPWFRLIWAASTGNYDLAEAQLRELLEQLGEQRQQHLRSLRRSLALALASELALSSQMSLPLLRLLACDIRETATQLLALRLPFHGDQADLNVLGGLLALERGLPRVAERFFETARRTSQEGVGGWQEIATRPLADAYLQRIRNTPK